MTVQIRTIITPLGAHSGQFRILLHGVADGWLAALQPQGDEWQRLGQSGSGTQIVGYRGRKATPTGWYGSPNLADATGFANAFESLETEVCMVNDDYGRTIPRVRFTDIRVNPRPTRGPTLSGGVVLFRCECSWSAEVLPNA